MIRVKVCGLTNLEGALLAVEAGASALGFIFAPSPRRVEPEVARNIIEQLPPLITTVGVFVDEAPARVTAIAESVGLGALQLHGSEPPEMLLDLAGWPIIKAFRPRIARELEEIRNYASAAAFLLDTFRADRAGGTGEVFDWRLALEAKSFGKPIILAGGLTAENVAEAIRLVKPYAVDVASGVELEPGRKDAAKLRQFMEAVARA